MIFWYPPLIERGLLLNSRSLRQPPQVDPEYEILNDTYQVCTVPGLKTDICRPPQPTKQYDPHGTPQELTLVQHQLEEKMFVAMSPADVQVDLTRCYRLGLRIEALGNTSCHSSMRLLTLSIRRATDLYIERQRVTLIHKTGVYPVVGEVPEKVFATDH